MANSWEKPKESGGLLVLSQFQRFQSAHAWLSVLGQIIMTARTCSRLNCCWRQETERERETIGDLAQCVKNSIPPVMHFFQLGPSPQSFNKWPKLHHYLLKQVFKTQGCWGISHGNIIVIKVPFCFLMYNKRWEYQKQFLVYSFLAWPSQLCSLSNSAKVKLSPRRRGRVSYHLQWVFVK